MVFCDSRWPLFVSLENYFTWWIRFGLSWPLVLSWPWPGLSLADHGEAKINCVVLYHPSCGYKGDVICKIYYSNFTIPLITYLVDRSGYEIIISCWSGLVLSYYKILLHVVFDVNPGFV